MTNREDIQIEFLIDLINLISKETMRSLGQLEIRALRNSLNNLLRFLQLDAVSDEELFILIPFDRLCLYEPL